MFTSYIFTILLVLRETQIPKPQSLGPGGMHTQLGTHTKSWLSMCQIITARKESDCALFASQAFESDLNTQFVPTGDGDLYANICFELNELLK